MLADGLDLLRLMQLADSAVPIGGAAHSFGLETLAAEEEIGVEDLPWILRDILHQSGTVDAVFCRSAHAARKVNCETNCLLSAMKPARESRNASLALGRRFLQLTSGLSGEKVEGEAHFSIAFGAVAGALAFPVQATVLAFLQQSITGIVSAAQRLMPLGQQGASRILWDIKSDILEAAQASANISMNEVKCFAPVMEMASMRHVDLSTRLFIS